MDAWWKGELEKTTSTKLAWNHHHPIVYEETLVIVSICIANPTYNLGSALEFKYRAGFPDCFVVIIKMHVKLLLILSV